MILLFSMIGIHADTDTISKRQHVNCSILLTVAPLRREVMHQKAHDQTAPINHTGNTSLGEPWCVVLLPKSCTSNVCDSIKDEE